jgi:hypothetical protein
MIKQEIGCQKRAILAAVDTLTHAIASLIQN